MNMYFSTQNKEDAHIDIFCQGNFHWCPYLVTKNNAFNLKKILGKKLCLKTFQPALSADTGFRCSHAGWGVEVNNTMQKQLHQHAAGTSADRCSAGLQAHVTWSSQSGLTARPLAPSSLHHGATCIPGGVGGRQMSWSLACIAGC